MTGKSALVLGAASPLGTALIQQWRAGGFTQLIAADYSRNINLLKKNISAFGQDAAGISIAEMNPKRPFSGLKKELMEQLAPCPVTIFHLAHERDRRVASADIRHANQLMLERALSIAYKLATTEGLLVATDVGLAGDYPGCFSENWIDVGQTPFDEVDRSSLAVELSCVEISDIPIVRTRVGLCLGPKLAPAVAGIWRSPTEELLDSTGLLRRLPRFLKIPMAVAKGALAPFTPVDWAAKVLLRLSNTKAASGKAFHLVLDSPPLMDDVLKEASVRAGGPEIRGGLPVDLIAKLGFVPGFKETARRNADQIASWWTPHRYCLSRNDLDTANLKTLFPDDLEMPTWEALRHFLYGPRP